MADEKTTQVQTEGTATAIHTRDPEREITDLFARGIVSYPNFVRVMNIIQRLQPRKTASTATTTTTTTTTQDPKFVVFHENDLQAFKNPVYFAPPPTLSSYDIKEEVHRDPVSLYTEMPPAIKVYDENKDMAVDAPSISYEQALMNSACFASPPPALRSSENKEEVATAAPSSDTEEYYSKADEAIDEWSADYWDNWKIDAHLLRPPSTPQDEQARRAVGSPVYGWYCPTCVRAFDYPSSLCAHAWYPRNHNFDDVD
jgi:hypothetical protein